MTPRILFAYDEAPPDEDRNAGFSVSAEYEDERTIDRLRDILSSIGEVVDVPWGPGAPEAIVREALKARSAPARRSSTRPSTALSSSGGTANTVVFNITEAYGSRNRESLIPALAEAAGLECTGTDAVGLGISLDKAVTKAIAVHLGIATPGWTVVDGRTDLNDLEALTGSLVFPVIVKPNTGGSSLGIWENSRVSTVTELKTLLETMVDSIDDRLLVEEFVAGREFTIGLLEAGGEVSTFPVAELRFRDHEDPNAFYSIERKSLHDKQIICPAEVDPEALRRMNECSVALFRELGCRDLARVDFRLSVTGIPEMLEINPLPGLSPYYGIFPYIAEKHGTGNKELIKKIVQNALRRANEPKR